MTKQERHKFYKELLIYVCKDPKITYGLCTAIHTASNWRHDMHSCPEIQEQRPKDYGKHGLFWFPLTCKGWEKRIAIIEEAIELTK